MKFYKYKNLRMRALRSSGDEKSFNVKDFLKRRKLMRQNPEEIKIGPKEKKFVPRLVYPRRDPKSSMWWEYVLGGTWADPTSRDGKTFRRRFRTTHDFFLGLVVRAKELFPMHSKPDALGRRPGPIELKVLGVLRVLGCGVCSDDCQEGTNMDKETHRKFFHAFCHKFARKYYSLYCHGPENEADMESCMSEYASAGFPGCLGSTDGVHISWDRCHAQQKYCGSTPHTV
jgi:hypothetical protein